MTNSNAKKSAYNVLFGLLSQVVTIGLGLIIPRLFLVNFGSEMNGLINSVSQVFVYLALLEVGVGGATIQALYSPIAKRNRESISGILAATGLYYRKTGRIYFIAVIAIALAYPLIVKTTIPYLAVVSIIILHGISSVVSYFFQGKYNLLLRAEGKQYVLVNISTLIHTAVNIVKIIMLLLGCNILLILTVSMLINLAQTVFILLYIRRHYPWLDLRVKPDYDAISKKDSVLVHQVSDIVFRNTDVLILTLICGLKTVSVYVIYSMLLGMISTAINTITSGVDFALGQTYHSNMARYVRLHDVYETYSIALIFSLYTVAYLFIFPFVKLYTSSITDIDYLQHLLPILFFLTFILSGGRNASAKVINFAQHFRETQGRAIFEAVLNIAVSLVGVFLWGIYGVLAGTIVALLYRTNDMILYANKQILHRSPWPTYRRWLICFTMFLLIWLVQPYMNWRLNTYWQIIGWAFVSIGIIVPLFLLIASLFEGDVYKFAKELFTPYIGRVFRFTR